MLTIGEESLFAGDTLGENSNRRTFDDTDDLMIAAAKILINRLIDMKESGGPES
ncbi:MAG: hypothetical protein JW765_00465 [Deltaproteobacteria bacterium]|nr:hypothetical protein [Candidatus Zymogenaceae bacterium]